MRMRTRKRRTKKKRKMNTDRRRLICTALLAAFVCAGSSALVGGQNDKSKDNSKDPHKHYALIFGTAFGPDERPLYGVKVNIHRADKKRPKWELISDHNGEFAARVPPGPGDYVIEAVAEIAPTEDGKVQMHKKKRYQAETRVHIDNEERQDIGLHLKEVN
jgi:hypothetical protein